MLVDPHGAEVRVINEGAEPLEQLELEVYTDEPTPRRVALPSLPPHGQRTVAAGSRLALAH